MPFEIGAPGNVGGADRYSPIAAAIDDIRKSLRIGRIVWFRLGAEFNAIAECFAEAQRDGTVSAVADPEAVATMLLGMIRGFEALRKGGLEPARLTAAAEQAIAFVVG